jgi:acyl-coenzyme A thioesterase PaaI-like protein
VAGFAAYSLVAVDEAVVTADLRVSYLFPGDAPLYLAKGWVIKPGNMLHFCESEVWGIFPEKKVLVAKSSSTMAVVKIKALEGK